MEQKTLDVSIRDTTKKGSAARLRREGKIPAIVYGRGEPTAIALDSHEFLKKFQKVSESTVIKLQSANRNFDVLVKDYQSDILSGKILHIDFYEVDSSKVVRTHVPIHTKGTPVGVREGGILEHLLHDVEVEALPANLPEFLEIDITGVKVGSGFHVADIGFPEGVKAITPPDQVLLTVTYAKAVVTPAAEEAAAAATTEAAAPEAAASAGE